MNEWLTECGITYNLNPLLCIIWYFHLYTCIWMDGRMAEWIAGRQASSSACPSVAVAWRVSELKCDHIRFPIKLNVDSRWPISSYINTHAHELNAMLQDHKVGFPATTCTVFLQNINKQPLVRDNYLLISCSPACLLAKAAFSSHIVLAL